MSHENLRRGRHSMPRQAYHVTTVTAGRVAHFNDFVIARLAIAEMRRTAEMFSIDSLAWVLMPDHLHWLFMLGDNASLGHVLKTFKGRSARSINLALGRNLSVWQANYHDHAIRADEDLRTIARYIVGNPLRAWLVWKLGDYPHWDAAWA
jgi:putative transposase